MRRRVLEWLAKRGVGEMEWVCYYPEFNDEGCLVFHSPEKTRMPRKHTECRWVLAVPVGKS